jgi:hypothetical protein
MEQTGSSERVDPELNTMGKNQKSEGMKTDDLQESDIVRQKPREPNEGGKAEAWWRDVP